MIRSEVQKMFSVGVRMRGTLIKSKDQTNFFPYARCECVLTRPLFYELVNATGNFTDVTDIMFLKGMELNYKISVV